MPADDAIAVGPEKDWLESWSGRPLAEIPHDDETHTVIALAIGPGRTERELRRNLARMDVASAERIGDVLFGRLARRP
jgi:hypothetical protein